MLGYQPISSLPISDIDLGAIATSVVIIIDGKIFMWTVPIQPDTWNIPIMSRDWTTTARSDKEPSTWTVNG
jgi:hypothetical protein|tara:strand:+ start:1737 stop:1949 length:213 start_codon:yes stop_codon:yes gene_type:complete